MQASQLGRRLLQPATTPVTTPAELQNAVAAGARHVVVQQHMDLSGLQLSVSESLFLDSSLLGSVLGATLSITVRFGSDHSPLASTDRTYTTNTLSSSVLHIKRLIRFECCPRKTPGERARDLPPLH